MTVVIHAMRLPRGVTNSTRSALSVPPARESEGAPSRPRASAMAAAGESISSAAGAPRVALLTGEPPRVRSLPSLVTAAVRPLPKTVWPPMRCTQYRWCTPPMST